MFKNLINKIDSVGLDVYGIEVFKKGEVIFRHMFAENRRYPIYSATKSFLTAAAGILYDEGKLRLDAPLTSCLTQEQLSLIPDKDTLRQLSAYELDRFLTMTVSGCVFRPEGADWLKNSLSQPFVYEPGPKFNYSNITAYLTGIALENIADEPLAQFLDRHIFQPLGIADPVYKLCPTGHFYGASGMELTVHELSILGQLFMQGGIYCGERIFTAEWAELAAKKHIDNSEGGYGYFLWTAPDSFRISGKWGQKCLIYPHKELMITYLSDLPERGGEMLALAESLASEL